MLAHSLTCPDCHFRTVCGADDLAARLRLVGLLRREKEPSEELIAELLPGAVGQMTCPTCKRRGLVLGDADDAGDDWGDDDWQAAVLCEVCREPIPPERLEYLPETKRCVTCQGKAEAGTLPDDDPEFCPRCGALIEIRVSRGSGLTRYKRFCTGSPPCVLRG
ncbi:MAG: TraR/DksA C4-type zinc finger protein [Planctomycetota bacterium]